MKHIGKLSMMVLSSVVIGFGSLAVANPDSSEGSSGWSWQEVQPLFPHTPGQQWVYALSGTQYPNGGELQRTVRGKQLVSQLGQEAVLIDETHPSGPSGSAPEVLPVLYYPREGYLVRDTSYIYVSSNRTSPVSTGNLGEAVTPVLPLWLKNEGTDWQPVSAEHWGKASGLVIGYRLSPEKEAVTVKSGSYTDCVRIEGTVTRGDSSGFRYAEWYAPGVGLVKSTTTDLQSGTVLMRKELIRFQSETQSQLGQSLSD